MLVLSLGIEGIMGSHIDTRQKQKQKHTNEDIGARKRRASFKSYLRQLEEDLLEQELEGDELDDPEVDEE